MKFSGVVFSTIYISRVSVASLPFPPKKCLRAKGGELGGVNSCYSCQDLDFVPGVHMVMMPCGASKLIHIQQTFKTVF